MLRKESIPTNEQVWLLDNSQVEILDVYEAKITGKDGDDYTIEFRDHKMEVVEANLSRKEFALHPQPIVSGMSFGIVIYKQKGVLKIGAWPLEKYWNKSLLKI